MWAAGQSTIIHLAPGSRTSRNLPCARAARAWALPFTACSYSKRFLQEDRPDNFALGRPLREQSPRFPQPAIPSDKEVNNGFRDLVPFMVCLNF